MNYSLRICIFSFVLFSSISGLAQGVTIGSNQAPDSAAVLDLQSTQGGFLLSRLNTQQRNALPTPPFGLQIYNTDTDCIEAYFSTGWKAIVCDCQNPPPSPSSIQGQSHVCRADTNVSFSIAPVQGATSYQWTIPGQDTLLSGQGSTSITVNFSGVQGQRNVQVVALNACGSSSPASLLVDVSNPDSTYTISPYPISTQAPSTFSAIQNGASYAWTFQNGTPASSNLQSPSVSYANTGTYQASLTITDADGCSSTLDSMVQVTSCIAVNQSFTPCGASGQNGPGQSQCNSSYGSGVVTVNNGIQTWSVPSSGVYRITVRGASGGGANPGRGVVLAADFSLSAGQSLQMVVGQQGVTGNDNNGSGGGGSYIVSNGQPLIVAGGGGGDGRSAQNGCRSDGTTLIRGNNGYNTCNNNNNVWSDYGYNQGMWGGSPGNGGGNGTRGGGGGGYQTDGNTVYIYSSENFFGKAFANGSQGGPGSQAVGGFGGAGGCNSTGGAGGGGYSGGGGGSNGGGGGGGGSFVASGASNVATSDGQYNGSPSFNGGIQNLNSWNTGHGSIQITRVCP